MALVTWGTLEEEAMTLTLQLPDEKQNTPARCWWMILMPIPSRAGIFRMSSVKT
jgi:hypothetical protein